MIEVPVGHLTYRVQLVAGTIPIAGYAAWGGCFPAEQVIKVSADVLPARRLAIFWHEYAHAVQQELDVHEAENWTPEPMANLIGMAMAQLTPHKLAMLYVYLTTGMTARDVLMFPDLPHPIPLVDLRDYSPPSSGRSPGFTR